MKNFTKKERKCLEEHTIMENHERGDFIGKVVRIIDDDDNIKLSGNVIIKKILEAYKEHVYDIECGSKKFARRNLRGVFNDEYFDLHPLSIHGFMKDFAAEMGEPVIYGIIDREIALEKLKPYIDGSI